MVFSLRLAGLRNGSHLITVDLLYFKTSVAGPCVEKRTGKTRRRIARSPRSQRPPIEPEPSIESLAHYRVPDVGGAMTSSRECVLEVALHVTAFVSAFVCAQACSAHWKSCASTVIV